MYSWLQVGFLLLIHLLMLFSSCNNSPAASTSDATLKKQVIVRYADIVYASYTDALNFAKFLEQSINMFLANPGEESMYNAKDAWLNARKYYSQTEAYRFYDGPIDNAVNGVESLLNAWPLDEVYVDYIAENYASPINIQLYYR